MWNQQYITPISINRSTHASLTRSSMFDLQTLVQTPDQQLVPQRRFQALHRLAQHAVATAPRVADDLACLRR